MAFLLWCRVLCYRDLSGRWMGGHLLMTCRIGQCWAGQRRPAGSKQGKGIRFGRLKTPGFPFLFSNQYIETQMRSADESKRPRHSKLTSNWVKQHMAEQHRLVELPFLPPLMSAGSRRSPKMCGCLSAPYPVMPCC